MTKLYQFSKNHSVRCGIFFYGCELDKSLIQLSDAEAYTAKSKLIEDTAKSLVAEYRRRRSIYLICVATHTYTFEDRVAPCGSVREPHIHVLFFSKDYRNGTTGFLNNFFGSREFPGNTIQYPLRML